MIKKEQMMNRHQIGYIYDELIELWRAKFKAHIKSVKDNDEYKELYEAYKDTKDAKTESKYRTNRLKKIIEIGDILEKLTEIDNKYYIGISDKYNTSRANMDYEAREYLKDKNEFVKQWNKSTESSLNNACDEYALIELHLIDMYNFTDYANTEMKSRLALIPIGEHNDIVKTILEEVTIEKVIEFVNA